MPSFTDSAGRKWPVEINTWTFGRVKKLLGVNLYHLINDGCKPLNELLSDPSQFVDVLYVVCKDEADARNVTDEAFGRSLGGNSLAEAMDAFMEAYGDFIPNPQVRDNLRAMLAKSRAMQVRLGRRMAEVIDRLDPEEVLKELERKGSSGAVPESSASTPGPSPSAS